MKTNRQKLKPSLLALACLLVSSLFLQGCVSSSSSAESADGTKMSSRAYSVGSKTGLAGAQSSQTATAPDGTKMERNVNLDEMQTSSQAPEIMQATGQLVGSAFAAMLGSPSFWQAAGQMAPPPPPSEPLPAEAPLNPLAPAAPKDNIEPPLAPSPLPVDPARTPTTPANDQPEASPPASPGEAPAGDAGTENEAEEEDIPPPLV